MSHSEENAQNFRDQGNELFKMRQWRDAAEFYTKALQCGEISKELKVACLLNRAAANLELGRCHYLY